MKHWFPLVLLTLSVTGCKLGPDYERPDLELPEDFSEPPTVPDGDPIEADGPAS